MRYLITALFALGMISATASFAGEGCCPAKKKAAACDVEKKDCGDKEKAADGEKKECSTEKKSCS